jgi:hypothetical protein
VGFLRKLFGGAGGSGGAGSDPAVGDRGSQASSARGPVDEATLDDEERARELELARFEQDRTDDLVRRQQRYADRSWTPPAQGGPLRAEDGDAALKG